MIQPYNIVFISFNTFGWLAILSWEYTSWER